MTNRSCSFCSLEVDRDDNAALNLELYYYSFILWQINSQSPIFESVVATLNACEKLVRLVGQQARLNEAGRKTLVKTGHKWPYLSSIGKSFRKGTNYKRRLDIIKKLVI